MSTTSRINKSTTRFVPKRKNASSSFQRASSTTPSLASVGTAATPRVGATIGLNPLGGIDEFELEGTGEGNASKEPTLPAASGSTGMGMGVGKGKGKGKGFAPRDPTLREVTTTTATMATTTRGSSSPVRPPTIASSSSNSDLTGPSSSRPLSFTPRDPTLSSQPTPAPPTSHSAPGPNSSASATRALAQPPIPPVASTSKTIDEPTSLPSLPPTPTPDEDEEEDQERMASTFTFTTTPNRKRKRVPRNAMTLTKATQAQLAQEDGEEDDEDSSEQEEPATSAIIRGKKLQMTKRGQVKRGQTGTVGTTTTKTTTKKAEKKDSRVGERRSTRTVVVSPEKKGDKGKGKGRMVEDESLEEEEEEEGVPRTTAKGRKTTTTKKRATPTTKGGRGGRPAKKSKVAEGDDLDEEAGPHEKGVTAPLTKRRQAKGKEKGKGKAYDTAGSGGAGGLQALLAAANAATEDEDYQMTDDAVRAGADAAETSDDTDSDSDDDDDDDDDSDDDDDDDSDDDDGSDGSQTTAIGADGSQTKKKKKKKSKKQRLMDKTRRLAMQETRPRFVPHKKLKDLDPALTTMSEIATGKDQWDGRVSTRGKALQKKHEMTKQERTEKRRRTKRHMKRRQEGLPSDTEDEEQGQVMVGFIEAAHQRGDALPDAAATDEEGELPDPDDVRPPRQVEIETPEPPSIEERLRAAMAGNEEGAAEEDDEDDEDRFVETGYAAQVRLIDGEFRIDEASLEVDRAQQARNAQLEPLERVEDNQQNKYTNSASWEKARTTAKWTAYETEVFYDALRQFGTDFEMIAGLFPTRTRRQIKSKWVREDKENPKKITAALMNKKEIDLDHYAALTGQNLSGPIPEDPMDRINKHREETEKLERENSVMPGGYGGTGGRAGPSRGVPGMGRQVELEDVEEEEGRAARQDGDGEEEEEEEDNEEAEEEERRQREIDEEIARAEAEEP